MITEQDSLELLQRLFDGLDLGGVRTFAAPRRGGVTISLPTLFYVHDRGVRRVDENDWTYHGGWRERINRGLHVHWNSSFTCWELDCHFYATALIEGDGSPRGWETGCATLPEVIEFALMYFNLSEIDSVARQDYEQCEVFGALVDRDLVLGEPGSARH